MLKNNGNKNRNSQVEVFWLVTLFSVMVGYQCFRHPCCLHLQGEVASVRENASYNRLRLERGWQVPLPNRKHR